MRLHLVSAEYFHAYIFWEQSPCDSSAFIFLTSCIFACRAGSGTTIFEFLLTVEVGDTSLNSPLDYVYGIPAFVLPPGSTIRRVSANPIIDAILTLTPPYVVLYVYGGRGGSLF